jgi:hypothetical protein
MSATGSGQSQFVREVAAQPYLFPYLTRESKQPGSRTMILNAAILCCNDQYVHTVRNLDDAYMPVSELNQLPDNDITAMMRINFNEPVYKKFVQLAWGCEFASQLLL